MGTDASCDGGFVRPIAGTNLTGPVYTVVLLAVFWALEMDNRLRNPRPLAHFVAPPRHW